MKNYEQPALELIKFSVMDVICASNGWNTNDETPEVPDGDTTGGSIGL